MFEFITHYYKEGSIPFRTLSELSEADAIRIMNSLVDDTPLFARFKEPIEYLRKRKQTESWLRNEFTNKGGQPIESYPLYAVLGTSTWIEKNSQKSLRKIEIELSEFTELDISFTFPDSMVSYWLSNEKPEIYYDEKYHGKVFTLSEITSLLNSKQFPELTLPEDVAPYFEAQIWNHVIVLPKKIE